ncbi:MAG: EAL domain-containing protein, partial [Streptosporangiales bacterium]
AGAWQREFGERAPFVSVNLAVRQVQQPGIVDVVSRVLAESELPPEQLQLELTESAIMESSGEPLRALRAIAALGPVIAIDDFGTGYSNLAYLQHLPVHVLKMAGSFVEGLADEADAGGEPTGKPVDTAIVSGLVSLAHALDLTVTAEGIETTAQARRLYEIGCECGQGWLYARPGPPEAIERTLREQGAAG